MVNAHKWVNEGGLFFMNKDHLCPECGELLEVATLEKVVNSNSPEAKDYDFSMTGTRGSFVGDVCFHIRCFYCEHCRKTFRVKEIASLEKAARKAEREERRRQAGQSET